MTATGTAAWATRLYDAGLVALSCWGGGKALPGRDHRALADNPPNRAEVVAADYNGGVAILCGTRHPAGGFVIGIDIDEGHEEFLYRPHGFLLLEAGTAPGRHHLFLRTADRLDGQINLRDDAHKFVCEIKGRGHALRSWPTRPEGKARGYTPVELATDPATDPPTFTAHQVADAMADLLTRCLGRSINVVQPVPDTVRHYQSMQDTHAPEWLDLVYEAICDHLQALGHRLSATGNGGVLTQCPLHDDHNPSLSLHPTRGWRCWAGCGEGRLTLLAYMLDVNVLLEVAGG